jgi:hypothetical protein
VRVGRRLQPEVFRALVLARPLRKTDEEPLLGSEAVPRLERHALRGFLPGGPGEDRAPEVGDVLARRQFSVDLDVVDDDIARVLIADAVRALLELLPVLLRPPVA